MSYNPPAKEILDDMLSAIERILTRLEGVSAEDFANDQDSLEIVSWNFVMLGEAAAQIPDDVVENHPEIPWGRAVGMRNRIVHGYSTVDAVVLWDTAQADLSPLQESLKQLRQGL